MPWDLADKGTLGRLLFTNVAVKNEFWRDHDRFTIIYNSFCFSPQKNYEYYNCFFSPFKFLKVSPLDPISLQSVSDNFLGVEFFSWSVTMKFCPQPWRVTRDHARWIPSLFPVRPNSSGYCICFFRPRVCSQDLRPRSDRQWFWKRHLRFISFSYLCPLSSNFAWVPLAFVLLFLFAWSKYYNSLWRTTIQVPEVTSNVSRVPHHVRDFSSVDPIFPSLQKPTFLNFNSMCNIADEELLCGCPLSWIKDLVYIICVYCSYWGVTRRGEFRNLRDAALRVNSTSIRKHMRTAFLDHQRTDVALC